MNSTPSDRGAAARARQAQLTKPPGSLGRLEDVAIALAELQGVERPGCRPAAALLFAADHPVVRHGVAAFPQEVTAAMVANFVGGGAAAAVAARHLGLPLEVHDVGVASPAARSVERGGARLVRHGVADLPAGDLRTEDAMSSDVFERCVAAGEGAVAALEPGTRVIVLGEMGIGNTTPASAVAAALLGRLAEELVGPGTGLDPEGVARKAEVVRDALGRLGDDGPLEVLRRVGGRELAAIAGAVLEASRRGIAVVVDGFIVSAAVLAAVRHAPEVQRSLLFGHRSGEPGHGLILEALDGRPLLDLGLRLGEGSGALAAFGLVELAVKLHGEMATFAEAGVPTAT